jgi:hypothetical protein
MNLILSIKDLYSYLTMWNLTLILLLSLGYLDEYYYDILFLSIYVSICSFIFTYIYPKKLLFKVDKINYEFNGRRLKLFDLICHHIPLILILNKRILYNKTYMFIIIPLLYKVLLNDNYKRYGLKDEVVFALYFIIFLFYMKLK